MPPVCSYDISSIAKKVITVQPNKTAELVLVDFCLLLLSMSAVAYLPFTYFTSRADGVQIPIILHTSAVTAKGWIREAQTGLVNFTGLMTTYFRIDLFDGTWKSRDLFRDVVAFPPSRFLRSFTECFWKFFFFSVRVCQKSSLSFFCHSPDCHSIEGESGSLSHALVLFLLPHMVGSKSSRLQNEHLWQRLMCVQWGKEQSRENTQQQIHYSPLDKPLSSLCFCLAHILVYSEVMEVGTMFLWIIVLPHHITDLIGSERPSLSPLPSIPLCAMNIELTIEI